MSWRRPSRLCNTAAGIVAAELVAPVLSAVIGGALLGDTQFYAFYGYALTTLMDIPVTMPVRRMCPAISGVTMHQGQFMPHRGQIRTVHTGNVGCRLTRIVVTVIIVRAELKLDRI
jgi:hypothetical protein